MKERSHINIYFIEVMDMKKKLKAFDKTIVDKTLTLYYIQ